MKKSQLFNCSNQNFIFQLQQFRPKCSGHGQLLLSQGVHELYATNLMLVSTWREQTFTDSFKLLAATLVTNLGKDFVLVSYRVDSFSGWVVCFGQVTVQRNSCVKSKVLQSSEFSLFLFEE